MRPPTVQANILELCESRLALAQDELWLLQTDPSYMQQTIAAARSMKLNAQLAKARRLLPEARLPCCNNFSCPKSPYVARRRC